MVRDGEEEHHHCWWCGDKLQGGICHFCQSTDCIPKKEGRKVSRVVCDHGIRENDYCAKCYGYVGGGGNDVVNHPPHYQSKTGLETIDVIEGFELGFRLANVIKYVLRCERKNGIEDLKKARWYLDREIQKRESGEKCETS